MATSRKRVNDTLTFPLVTYQHYNLQSEVQPYHPVQPEKQGSIVLQEHPIMRKIRKIICYISTRKARFFSWKNI